MNEGVTGGFGETGDYRSHAARIASREQFPGPGIPATGAIVKYLLDFGEGTAYHLCR